MSLSITSTFDSGNIDIVSIDGTDVQLAIRPDQESDFLQWFYFRIDGIRNHGCRITIVNASQTTYPKGWQNYHVATSADQQHWYRTPSRFDGKALSWSVKPGQDVLWFAYFAPYPVVRHTELIARSAQASGVELESLGQTLDGRSIDCLHIRSHPEANETNETNETNEANVSANVIGASAADAEEVAANQPLARDSRSRRHVWAIARQHPGESMAEWWMEGWLARLLDPDDATSRALRRLADIHVVPNMNPDGSYRGHLRTNAAGANLNREWAEPTLSRSPEVFHVRNCMRRTGVDLALDIHGDEALPYNFIAGTEGIADWNEQRDAQLRGFKRTLSALNPDFQFAHGYPINRAGTANLSIASNHIAATHGCLAMTLEMPFKDTADTPRPSIGWSPERCVRLGRSFVDAVYLTLTDKLLSG